MKVRIKVPLTGLYNGEPWPQVGKTIDLPDHVAEGMIRVGHVEAVAQPAKKAEKPAEKKVETRPAPAAGVETRPPLPPAQPAPQS